MPKLRDAATILSSLDGGEVLRKLSAEMTAALVALDEDTGRRPKAKAKGSVTLKVSFEVENGMVNVGAEISSKLPKPTVPSSFFWLLADGALSTDHPKQIDMFPREVEHTA